MGIDAQLCGSASDPVRRLLPLTGRSDASYRSRGQTEGKGYGPLLPDPGLD